MNATELAKCMDVRWQVPADSLEMHFISFGFHIRQPPVWRLRIDVLLNSNQMGLWIVDGALHKRRSLPTIGTLHKRSEMLRATRIERTGTVSSVLTNRNVQTTMRLLCSVISLYEAKRGKMNDPFLNVCKCNEVAFSSRQSTRRTYLDFVRFGFGFGLGLGLSISRSIFQEARFFGLDAVARFIQPFIRAVEIDFLLLLQNGNRLCRILRCLCCRGSR